jgi:acyl carrier protein
VKLGLQIGLTCIFLITATAHLIFPDVKIDSIAVTLLILSIVPWLGIIFESLELPGGLKFKYSTLQAAADEVAKSTLITVDHQGRIDDPTYISLLDEDPTLALAGLRIDIERRLRQIATKYSDLKARGVGSLVNALSQRELLSDSERNAIQDILSSLNEAVHGAKISREQASRVMEIGRNLTDSLEQRFQKSN